MLDLWVAAGRDPCHPGKMNLCRLAILILALLPRTSLAKILDYSESSWAVTVQAHGAWMGAGNSIYGLDVPGDFTWDGGMDGA